MKLELTEKIQDLQGLDINLSSLHYEIEKINDFEKIINNKFIQSLIVDFESEIKKINTSLIEEDNTEKRMKLKGMKDIYGRTITLLSKDIELMYSELEKKLDNLYKKYASRKT